jgi:hypothetical protein
MILHERTAAFALGFFAVVILQAAYGWWLNSASGVLRTTAVLLALGFLIAIWRSGSRWARAAALWAGSLCGASAALFWLGPGNLFPIVLAFAAALSGAAVFAGASVAALMRRHGP